VELASDGRVIEIPADRTILQVLTENGVNVIASCQEGTCGTCETGIVSGTADHRDSVLTKEEQDENEYMMVCCSRSKCPRLVLDL
jgi:ferredoxin